MKDVQGFQEGPIWKQSLTKQQTHLYPLCYRRQASITDCVICFTYLYGGETRLDWVSVRAHTIQRIPFSCTRLRTQVHGRGLALCHMRTHFPAQAHTFNL